MQIVVDIPKYVYDTIIACDGYISDCDNEKVGNAIKNGTPLPKGHGRLIDEDQIPGDGGWDFSDRLMSTPTIIEADEESEEICR